MSGWLKLHRALSTHAISSDPQTLSVWVHILMLANFVESKKVVNGKMITIHPGQLITSRASLATRVGVSESKIQRVLSLLESEQQIEQLTNSRYRLITVLAWDKYQGGEQPDEQPANIPRTSHEHTIRSKEFKKDKKESKTLGAEAPAPNKKTSLGVDFLTDQGVDSQHAADWLKARKVPLTQTAWVAIEREAAKAGITSAMAVQLSAENTWRGFKAEWYANRGGSNGHQASQGQRIDNSAIGRVKRAIAEGQAREAQPEAVRHAKPQDGGDLRPPLDGEFWRED
jgi:hypothetical protein